jgi:two-component system, OmpR family, alkaline phosphatase synthesis response regulator PhoP
MVWRSDVAHHRIVVVEDDVPLRETITDLLELASCRVESFGEAAPALRYLREDRDVCLVLLDLMTPGMNGWEFLDRKRSDESVSSVPVVVMTATVNPGVMAPLLRKPMKLDTLLHTIERHCRCASPEPPPQP